MERYVLKQDNSNYLNDICYKTTTTQLTVNNVFISILFDFRI